MAAYGRSSTISSYQIGRDIGVLPMTALQMQRKIREQMQTSEGSQLLKGIVEVDETHIGGRPRGHRRWRERWESTKVPILGFVERGGRVVMVIIDYPNAENMVPLVNQQVKANAQLMTDQAYHHRQVKASLKHESVNHGIAYVRGEVHTNTIEGVRSLLKRAFNGTHHHYSKKWMPLYLAEAAYKYNVRKIKDTWSQFVGKVFRYLLYLPGYT
ncbi:MAG: IS1595 family transposase [Gemmatimonadota bacterium]|nr:IS1595 family transposase [Gemmatimonadota bacterium]